MMDACNLRTAPEPLDGDAPTAADAPAATQSAAAPDFVAAVGRLAALSIPNYEACRREEARILGVRPTVPDSEVKRARTATAALAAPAPPAQPGAADLASTMAELAGLDAATYALALRPAAKRLGLSPKELSGLVTQERRRATAEAANVEGSPLFLDVALADPRGRTDLFVNPADLPDTAELAGLLGSRPMLFDHGVPVRLAMDSQRGGLAASPLDLAGVVKECHAAARPWTHNKARDGELVRQDVTLPDRVARLYLDHRGAWQLRPLDGIASAPLLAEGGSARAAEGYDAGARLWCERIPVVDLPERPTEDEARAALHRLRLRLRTFAFADAPRVALSGCPVLVSDVEQPPGLDESTALVALLTAVCRPSLHLAPGLAVAAPTCCVMS